MTDREESWDVVRERESILFDYELDEKGEITMLLYVWNDGKSNAAC